MAQLRGMMAASLDGFVADAAGGVDFLTPFAGADWGYADFIAQIGTVVMGRRTYQHMLTLAPDWPYPSKRGYVLGRGIAGPLRGGAQVWDRGLPALVDLLRGADQDAWIVGGPRLQADLIAMGALDRLELCLVPHLLGQGVRLFPDGGAPPRQPRLAGTRTLPLGMVMLDYRFGD